eukprot:TRINITY_DN2475_c0_g1_i1.p1 TRINITY_DN2475_c0_g1~~TRINITY_DN2475_c0_g1_i1.p1  ORF type:complete len:288 (-),score=54.84 TRINITY_DN2475_c0_g1_i1:26-889(-)
MKINNLHISPFFSKLLSEYLNIPLFDQYYAKNLTLDEKDGSHYTLSFEIGKKYQYYTKSIEACLPNENDTDTFEQLFILYIKSDKEKRKQLIGKKNGEWNQPPKTSPEQHNEKSSESRQHFDIKFELATQLRLLLCENEKVPNFRVQISNEEYNETYVFVEGIMHEDLYSPFHEYWQWRNEDSGEPYMPEKLSTKGTFIKPDISVVNDETYLFTIEVIKTNSISRSTAEFYHEKGVRCVKVIVHDIHDPNNVNTNTIIEHCMELYGDTSKEAEEFSVFRPIQKLEYF